MSNRENVIATSLSRNIHVVFTTKPLTANVTSCVYTDDVPLKIGRIISPAFYRDARMVLKALVLPSPMACHE